MLKSNLVKFGPRLLSTIDWYLGVSLSLRRSFRLHQLLDARNVSYLDKVGSQRNCDMMLNKKNDIVSSNLHRLRRT